MKEDFDVLFVGTSVTNCGISPLDLWHDYGIVSYNIANSGQGPGNSYYALMDALRVQHPKLIVMDVSYIAKETTNTGFNHLLFDNMPIGRAKIEGITDRIDRKEWAEYFFPLFYYHQRWNKLEESDFQKIEEKYRGATVGRYSEKDGEIFDTSVFSEPLYIVPEDEREAIPDTEKEYFEKIIQLCKDNGVEILFVNVPSYAYGDTNHGDGETLQRMWNEFSYFANEQGADYLNGLHMVDEISFDFVEDLRDWRHLNVEGNYKITSWLGDYIVDKYGIPDRRDEAGLDYWNEDYQKWREFIDSLYEDDAA